MRSTVGLILCLSGSVAVAAPPCPPQELQVGVETRLVWQDDGAPVADRSVRVVHRPGLPTQRDAGVGITDSAGHLVWTPTLAGPAHLVVEGLGTCPVHVRWGGIPIAHALPALIGVLLAWGLHLVRLRGSAP